MHASSAESVHQTISCAMYHRLYVNAHGTTTEIPQQLHIVVWIEKHQFHGTTTKDFG